MSEETKDLTISYADLAQFQFTYSFEEDRILIEFHTTQKQSYKAWISRLFTHKVWPVFIQVLQQQEQQLNPISFEAKEKRQISDQHIEKHFEHQDNVVPQIEFWGEETSGLVHTLQIEAKESQILSVKLLDKQDRGVLIHLSYSLFQVFCGLIIQTVEHSQWELNLEHSDWVANLTADSNLNNEITNHTIN
jgi:hypothetical protein